MLHEINEEARAMLVQGVQHAIAIGKNLRTLIEDHGRRRPEVVLNWKEMETQSANDLQERMIAAYKQLYYFVQLMQFYSR